MPQQNASGGIGMQIDGASVSYNQSKVDSHYQSVTAVSGIAAGSGGFDITVGGNTHLAGGVIASAAEASKNRLDTGSLTYEHLKNEADYSASSIGLNAGYGSGSFSASPALGMPQSGHSSSETKAGMAQGTIIVRDGNADLSGLDRNPSLDDQTLKPIFDAQKVQEQMEMGQLMGQVGMRAAGDMAGKMGWPEGSPERTLLHGLVGVGMAAMGGGDVTQAVLGAGANQLVIQKMAEFLENQGYEKGTPEFATMLQLGSAAIGAAVGEGSGAAAALAGTQYNYLTHLQLKKANEDWDACHGDQACQSRVLNEAQALSQKNDVTLRSLCNESPGSNACKSSVNEATTYGALWEKNGYALESDMTRSDTDLMQYLMDTPYGYQYYPSLDNRKDFFQAFQNALEAKGNEVVWPQVAANVSGSLQSVNDWYCPSCGNASAWVDYVGKAIMKFEWPELQKLYNGPALTGDAAKMWDTGTLIHEQMTLQPFYDQLKSQGGWSYGIIGSGGYINTGTDIFNVYNRIDYGLDKLKETQNNR